MKQTMDHVIIIQVGELRFTVAINGILKINVSLVVALGPSYLSSSKQSESLQNVVGWGKDVEDYVKNMSFQPMSSIPLILVGYTF